MGLSKPLDKEVLYEQLRKAQVAAEDYLLWHHCDSDHELQAVWMSIEQLWRNENEQKKRPLGL